jgi:hypothetical protein
MVEVSAFHAQLLKGQLEARPGLGKKRKLILSMFFLREKL